jgi:hypothetical protein
VNAVEQYQPLELPAEQSTRDEPPPKRYHDFDALRAFAMLLGIALHALMSFVELPPGIWPAQDVKQNTLLYGFGVHALHGFRLPLFFLMSGFFTSMLWRKRGLRKLIAHRAKRILLPLIVGWFAVWPALIVVGMIGGDRQVNVWDAAANGRAQEVRRYLAAGGDCGATFALPGVPGAGATPLHLAAAGGHDEVIRILLDHGAPIDAAARDRNQGTPLHWAIAGGKAESVEILLAAGADIHAENQHGQTPLDLATALETTHAQGGAIVAYLQDKGGRQSGVQRDPPSVLGSRLMELAVLLLCFAPFFAHLWFLWFLCWYVAGFAVVAWLSQRLQWNGLSARTVASPYCWLWLLPLTLLAQLGMVQTFGPDTSAGLVPWPPVLAYYAIFFGYGAVLYGHPDVERNAGRHWKIWLLVASATLPLGVWLFETRPVHDILTLVDFNVSPPEVPRRDLDLSRHLLTSLCAVAYCWSMILALMGLSRWCFSQENAWIRYISDSAYWLYLAHLPLIQLLQVLVQDWSWPAFVKITVICAVTVAVLLVIYEYGVRYTLIGTMLNGKRYRQA